MLKTASVYYFSEVKSAFFFQSSLVCQFLWSTLSTSRNIMPFPFLLACMLACEVCTHAQAIDLGAAASYGLSTAVAISNIGPTVINGNIAVFPGTNIIRFPLGSSLEPGLSARPRLRLPQSALTTKGAL